jgi:phage terminase large subunit-like protein
MPSGFFERYLRHTKGQWAGVRFALEPWQKREIIEPLFGWKRADGSRQYRRAYIELPRKNGKSTLSSGLALYLLFADGEAGAEVYSAAADTDQARIVFDQARAMVEESPSLLKRAQVFKKSIVIPKARSSYRVLSADAFTKHGLNASGIVFDELHAQPNRDLYDVLRTSTGARRQPLMVMITTAGFDRTSICWEEHEYARQILSGVNEDSSYFAFIAAAPEDADWTDEKVWAAANPGMGVTVTLDYLREECQKAIQSPAYQNTFRRLHLNQWTSQESRWLDLRAWDACAAKLPDLAGRACYGGLDLSSSQDLTSFVLAFAPEEDSDEPVWTLPFFWVPEEGLIERARKDRVPYDAWARDGLIEVTPGNVIDYGFIEEKITALGEVYNIRQIAFDRWGAVQMSQNLMGAGFEMVQMGQGFASMSHPTKELMRLTLAQQVGHGGHEVLRWMADNLVVDTDAAGNVKPNKKKSRERIDGMVALVMALDRAVRNEGPMASVYEERGVFTL